MADAIPLQIGGRLPPLPGSQAAGYMQFHNNTRAARSKAVIESITLKPPSPCALFSVLLRCPPPQVTACFCHSPCITKNIPRRYKAAFQAIDCKRRIEKADLSLQERYRSASSPPKCLKDDKLILRWDFLFPVLQLYPSKSGTILDNTVHRKCFWKRIAQENLPLCLLSQIRNLDRFRRASR